ncbi:CRISPR-associated helicase Cas3' [Sorangium cellulosum]|uniref:CRISPR-associated helicase Cas3' n=1 Tax=Sorangium cellulosum TaxID=56 RepID=UPI003D9A7DA0
MTGVSLSPAPSSPLALDPRVWQLWGKADPTRASEGGPEWHPLLCHVLDVVACAERLLVHMRPDRLDALAAAIALPPEGALPWLLLFVALHDLGKATPPFQVKVPGRADALRALGLDFPERDEPHGSLSAVLTTKALAEYGVPSRLARWVARSVGAHHGEFASLGKLALLEQQKGILLPVYAGKEPLWSLLRTHLVQALAGACGISSSMPRPAVPSATTTRHAFTADLAGLTTVADWLGSNADVFKYVEPPASPAEYLALAQARAVEALDSAGWRRPPQPPIRTFRDLFEKDPWPLHEAIEKLLPALRSPSLMIIEAPMGEGKTEAALTIFDALAARGATGLYFALPTQATSNQIFGRVERFIRAAFPGETHGLHLVHGDAGLSERYGGLKARAFAMRSIDGVARGKGGPVADAWFARSKRALLAPLAVGTVDQALLGVLGVRHGFLRLHGLAGKVVVIDEVHAYDTYTSELLDRLLSWLGALGTTVVLLSATLPAARREALVRAYGAAPAAPTTYPRITVATEGAASSVSFPGRRAPIPVSLVWQPAPALPERLAEALAGGGCAVWIVNTVRRAQQTYLALRDLRDRGLLPADLDLGLLHARFPFDARAARERAAEESFGPGEANRPRAALLVGTQVLEQSLDLDFDLMISELAPVDLVLQRAGRLHRHARQNPRPSAVQRPALWLVRPEGDERSEGPTFGGSALIYDESVLLRSWLALCDRTEVVLPTDIEPLIEVVYGGAAPQVSAELAARLAQMNRDSEERERNEGNQARAIELAAPDADDPFDGLARVVEDEDPSLHRSLRAKTRLGEPSIEVVPVFDRGGRVVLAGAPDVVLDLEAREPLPHRIVVAAARQAVGISHRAVVAALLHGRVPPSFEASGHLRFHRVLRLDDAGRTTVAGVPLTLDPELGLVVGSLDTPDDATPQETSACPRPNAPASI